MEIRITEDGSATLWSEQYGETYHSGFGAITESEHVFIGAGFRQVKTDPVHIFEMGFGSGLNALLTYKASLPEKIRVIYHAVELNPVPSEIINSFKTEAVYKNFFTKLHEAEWNKPAVVADTFELTKFGISLTDWIPAMKYHLVYFDAFSPEVQPELWTKDVFEKVFQALLPGGVLTTYCAKGYVRRNMIAAGFKVERLPGPPGKREILRAKKQCEIQVDS